MHTERKRINYGSTLWFRRWSRSRAAVFRSLGRSVAIGHLTNKVLVRLERKTKTLLSLDVHPMQMHTPLYDAAEDDEARTQLHIEQNLLQTIAFAATDYTRIIPFYI